MAKGLDAKLAQSRRAGRKADRMCKKIFRASSAWASEGFFPGGPVGGVSQHFFQGRTKSGEIWFLPLEIKKTTIFTNNFKIQRGAEAPSSDAHGRQYSYGQIFPISLNESLHCLANKAQV